MDYITFVSGRSVSQVVSQDCQSVSQSVRRLVGTVSLSVSQSGS